MRIYSFVESMKNQSFKKAYDFLQKLLDGFSNAEILSDNMIVQMFVTYIVFTDEFEISENIANFIWSIFI